MAWNTENIKAAFGHHKGDIPSFDLNQDQLTLLTEAANQALEGPEQSKGRGE